MLHPNRTVPAACYVFGHAWHHLRLALTAIGALTLQLATVRATDYYFSTTTGTTGIPANDLNLGTMEAPMRTVKKANEMLRDTTRINRVFFKRGEIWYDSAVDHRFNLQDRSGTGSNTRLEISAWGSGARPIISTLNKLPNNTPEITTRWQRLPNTTIWYQAVNYPQAWRLYVNGVSKFNVESPWWDQRWLDSFGELNPPQTPPPRPTENSVQPNQWYIKANGAQGIVYYNTGTTNPPQNVEVHPRGQDPVLFMKNSDYVSVRGVDFRGGSQYRVVQIEAPCDNIVFDSNTIMQSNHSGIVVGNQSGTNVSETVSNIWITNNIVDKTWTLAENDPRVLLSGDGIAMFHAVNGGLGRISDNLVTNFGHTGIELTSYRAGFFGVKNVTVERNRVWAGNSGYMHAFDMNGFEGLTMNNKIRRNFFRDSQATCHVQGNNNYFYSNILARVRLTTMPRHSKQPHGVDLEPWAFKNQNGVIIAMMVAHHNLIAHNTFYDIAGNPIKVGGNGENTTDVNDNMFYNNLVVNYGYGQTSFPDVGINVDPFAPGPTFVRNNNFWDGGSSSPGTVAVARYPTYPNSPAAGFYTAAGLSQPAPDYCSNNQQLNPHLTPPSNSTNAADFSLGDSASVILKYRGLAVTETLRPPDAEWVDYFGSALRVSTSPDSGPSFGAIQWPLP